MAEIKTIAKAGGSTPNRRRLVTVTIAVAVLLACVAVIGWRTMARRVPLPDGDPVAIAKFSATPEFAALPLAQREPYLRTLRSNMKTLAAAAESGKLSREEQVLAVRNGIKSGARIEMANYFNLPAGPARQAHLDKLIAEQRQLQSFATKMAGNGTPPATVSALEMKQFMESLPPEDRVKMAEFAFDMFRRRAEQGLSLWPWGGGTNGAK